MNLSSIRFTRQSFPKGGHLVTQSLYIRHIQHIEARKIKTHNKNCIGTDSNSQRTNGSVIAQPGIGLLKKKTIGKVLPDKNDRSRSDMTSTFNTSI